MVLLQELRLHLTKESALEEDRTTEMVSTQETSGA